RRHSNDPQFRPRLAGSRSWAERMRECRSDRSSCEDVCARGTNLLERRAAMSVQSVTPVLNVSSVGASLAWFETLGWRRGFSWNEGGMIGEGAEAAASNEHGDAGFGSVCSGEATIFL